MNKKSLSETSIITKDIFPAITNSVWNQEQIAQEVSFTDGRITVRKKIISRGRRKREDIIFYYKDNLPSAILNTNLFYLNGHLYELF